MVAIFAVGRVLQVSAVPGYGLIVIMLGTIAVILRRKYLKMSPLWDSRLKDIPSYFKKP